VPPVLDPTSDRPAYRQIADHLRLGIQRGEYSPGTQLPSERELTEAYKAARGTVRQAIALLRSEGLIEIDRGRGVFVRENPPVRRLASDRFARRHRRRGKAAFSVEAESEGTSPQVEVLRVESIPAPDDVAGRLGLSPGAPVLLRRRRYLLDGRPMEVATSYVPWPLAEDTRMVEPDTGPGGIYARLEESGHVLKRFTEDVRTRMPAPDEVRLLALPPGVPVIALVRTAYDTNGSAVEVCDTVMAGDRYVLSYDFPAR
jgi:GntR family transcriptional regulator